MATFVATVRLVMDGNDAKSVQSFINEGLGEWPKDEGEPQLVHWEIERLYSIGETK